MGKSKRVQQTGKRKLIEPRKSLLFLEEFDVGGRPSTGKAKALFGKGSFVVSLSAAAARAGNNQRATG